MLRAMVGDIADDQRLKTGKEQSGLLFSIFNVTNNAAAAAAVGLAYPLIGWFGFVPGRTNSHAALAASPCCLRSAPPSDISFLH